MFHYKLIYSLTENPRINFKLCLDKNDLFSIFMLLKLKYTRYGFLYYLYVWVILLIYIFTEPPRRVYNHYPHICNPSMLQSRKMSNVRTNYKNEVLEGLEMRRLNDICDDSRNKCLILNLIRNRFPFNGLSNCRHFW